ncbi:MAG: tetratricopeptide repeat protein [Myxococcota bacterium]
MTTLLSTAQAWSRLSTHIEWADRFWVLFVFTDDPRVSNTLRQRTHDQLAGEGIGFRVLSPEGPEGVDDVITGLLAGPPIAINWVDLVHHDDPTGEPAWAEAWARVMMRLNERREALRRRSPQGGIVFATTLGRLDQTPALAPDLWTIRALLLRVATEPGPLPSIHVMDFEVRSPGPRRVPTRDRELARQAVAQAPGRDLKRLAALVALVEAETGDATLEPAHEVDALVTELAEALALEQQGSLVNALRRVGDVLVAEKYDADAVPFYRHVAERGEVVYGTRAHPEVAAALGGLGRALAQMARYSKDHSAALRKEALEVTRESVEVSRELAREHSQPEPYQRALAEALDSLVLRLKESNHAREALVVCEEVVEHWQALVDQVHDQALARLATALRTLGDCYAALGQREEALASTQHAVALHRDLASRRPRRFLSQLAQSLFSLGVRLNQVGRLQEGLDAQEEAHALIRDAAAMASLD